jgi:Mg-chelatase subunit ChlD
MRTPSIFKILNAKFRTGLLQFGRARSGTVAMIFGLSLLPVTLAIGVAIDYSRIVSYSSRLNAAADAGALAGASVTHDPVSGAVVDPNILHPLRLAAATGAFQANLANSPQFQNVAFSMTEISGGVSVTANATINHAFASLLNMKSTRLGAKANAVQRATTPLEVVFVLDNTGSMGQFNKMPLLKASMQKFLGKLQNAATAKNPVKVGLVPFTTMVKMNPGSAIGQPWLKQNAADTLFWQGCFSDRNQPYDVDNTPATSATPATQFEAADGSTPPNMFPYLFASPCNISPMVPLTNNFVNFGSQINAMTPNGATNPTIGLAWGLQMLTPSPPFNNATLFNSGTQKVLVFLTDGLSTQNRWTNNAAAIDARATLACAAIRAKNIKIYSIGLMQENATLLTNCASTPANHFFVANPTQIPDLFDMIANDMITLRLSK